MNESISVSSNSNTDIVNSLKEILGDKLVKTGSDVEQRACSYWDSSQTRAKALVLPETTEQVSKILKICNEANQTVVTHGGLTGCVEGAHSHSSDIIISLEKMSAIQEIDSVGRTMIVESGAILEKVQQAVEKEGLYFPLDLGARGSCTIGGNIATNAGGINVLRYGMMRNLVLGLEVVRADGTIVSSMNQMLKNNAGYDIKQLFIGSEGTLGIVTKAVLRLFPKPTSSLCAFMALDSFEHVASLLNSMSKEMGGTLSAFEIMWNDYYQAMTRPGRLQAPLDKSYPFYILMEVHGNDQARDQERFELALEKSLSSEQVLDVVVSSSEAQRETLWKIREGLEFILDESHTFMYDVSLPIKSMDDYVKNMQSALLKVWPDSKCYVFGHVGDGNLHIFVQPFQPSGTMDNLREISDKCVYQQLKEFNGSVSAEHGIGTEKKDWLNHSRSDEEIQLMKIFKNALDPKNILNPGVVFDL